MANLSITAANVVAAVGASTQTGTAGATITAGMALYRIAASGKLGIADCTDSAKDDVMGIALHGASDGQPLTYVTAGNLNPGATVGVGKIYVLGETGGIAPVDDIDTTDYVTVIGIGTTTSNISVNLHASGVLAAAAVA